MKIGTKFFITLLVVVFFVGCKSKSDKCPQEFGFRVFTETSVINSFDLTYRRKYYRSDSVVGLHFSEAELQTIYNSIVENDLVDYPENYYPDCRTLSFPCSETKLQFTIRNKTKTLTYKYDGFYFPVLEYLKSRRHEKVLKTIKLINSIVNNKSSVKKLSASKIYFK